MRLGLAVVAGVPVLVLVSLGPVAALTGSASVLVWAASATMGLFMSVAFAELAATSPRDTGGIGVLAARVLRPRSRLAATVVQWSYWFGWSPALAINGALVGNYLHELLLPQWPSSWTPVLLATVVLVAGVAVNHVGLRHGARVQTALAACVVGALVFLVAGALTSGQLDLARLLPFGPPGGWSSRSGVVALAGGLFIAGWSAYGSEMALSYSTEYQGGVRDAVGASALVGLVSVVVYSIVPLILVGVLGAAGVQRDPAVALTEQLRQVTPGAAGVVVGTLIVALLLGLNMVTIGSSRTLAQMARNGDAWSFLGRLNRHGVPSNALRFDMAVNVVLLLVVVAINEGRTATLPIALLAAANVSYFVSITLALVAAWLSHRGDGHRLFSIRPGFLHGGLALAVVNVVLLASAGFAWGWRNVTVGALALFGVVLGAHVRQRKRIVAPALGDPVVHHPRRERAMAHED